MSRPKTTSAKLRSNVKAKTVMSKEVKEAGSDPQLIWLLGEMDKELKQAVQKPWSGTRMTDVSHAGMHGRLGSSTWAAPRLMISCSKEARPGYVSMKADEYQDEPSVLLAKVKAFAALIRQSRQFCAYTGAGISTASGINDYASKAKNSIALRRKKVSGLYAQPTLAHRVMAAIHKAGHLKHWVQQNHDGLPQKAGFPPEHLNEIHGAWFDPSNPVVPMTGTLRGDLCEWMEEWEEKTDLCLAMGTSLCGMNADRMVETPVRKAASGDTSCLGAVIVGLQRTQHDAKASLRFFCKCDELMALLARELGLVTGNCAVKPLQTFQASLPPATVLEEKKRSPSVLKVPYNAKGELTTKPGEMVNWDLRDGARVMVTAGPGKGYVGTIVGRSKEGHVRVKLPCQREGSPKQGKVWQVYLLGQWWWETAVHGKAPLLPVVNTTLPIRFPIKPPKPADSD